MWYHEVIGGGRCPIVDTWWQTETGAHHDHAAARASRRPSRAAARGRSSASTPQVVKRDGTPCAPNEGGFLVIKQAVAVDAAHDPRRPRALQKQLLVARSPASTSPATARARTRTATSGSWAASTTCSTSPATAWAPMEIESALVSHPSVAEAAVVGPPHELKGQAIVAFVTLKAGVAADAGAEEGAVATTWSRRSARWPGPTRSASPTRCPRRARARSCGGCCKEIATSGVGQGRHDDAGGPGRPVAPGGGARRRRVGEVGGVAASFLLDWRWTACSSKAISPTRGITTGARGAAERHGSRPGRAADAVVAPFGCVGDVVASSRATSDRSAVARRAASSRARQAGRRRCADDADRLDAARRADHARRCDGVVPARWPRTTAAVAPWPRTCSATSRCPPRASIAGALTPEAMATVASRRASTRPCGATRRRPGVRRRRAGGDGVVQLRTGRRRATRSAAWCRSRSSRPHAAGRPSPTRRHVRSAALAPANPRPQDLAVALRPARWRRRRARTAAPDARPAASTRRRSSAG